MTDGQTPDSRKQRVAAAFGAAADGYEASADLQRQVAGRLAGRIAGLPLPAGARILEIGCGTGFLSRSLRDRFGPAGLVLTDLSEAMVRRCRDSFQEDNEIRWAVMDGERPCFQAADPAGCRSGGFDLVCASLAFQWFGDLGAALPRLAALLAPGGWLAYATLTAGSLAEWRAAHAALGLAAGVPDYPSAEHLQTLWPAHGEGWIETETILRHHPDARAFVAGLKAIGADTPAPGHTPLPPGALRRVLKALDHPAGITMRWEIAYGIWQRAG